MQIVKAKSQYELCDCSNFDRPTYKQCSILVHCVPYQKWTHLFFSLYPNDATCDAKSQVCKYQNCLETHLSLVLTLYDTVFNHATVARDFCLLHASYAGWAVAPVLLYAQLREQQLRRLYPLPPSPVTMGSISLRGE